MPGIFVAKLGKNSVRRWWRVLKKVLTDLEDFCWDISRFIHYWDFFAAQGVSQYTHSIKKIIASASDWKIHITLERIGF